MERKLAAIMAGDISGYSRLMAENEASTYNELRSVFDHVITPLVTQHGGRTFKSNGDGFLATFASVNQALDAAVAIQKGFSERSFNLRIGINLGDVIEENGDMFGDGVNIASRLEAMAEPGTILVSAAVALSADRNRGQQFSRLGRRPAKNLPDLLEVYEVRARKRPAISLRGIAASRRVALPLLFAVAGVGLLVAGARLPTLIDALPASIAGTTVLDRRPTIAVMPFSDISGGGDAYFASGLTEDVTTSLAQNPELQVIARNSTQSLHDQSIDVREVGRRLRAGYIVEGSSRRSGDQLRVTAQLIDVATGAHLWSQSYDRPVGEVFAVQRDLTAEIVSHLASYVRRSEVKGLAGRSREDYQAYDLVLKARDRYRHGSRSASDLLAARQLYLQALAHDPNYALAHAYLGLTYVVDASEEITGVSMSANVAGALAQARAAVQLDPDLPIGYQVLSYALSLNAEYGEALQAAEQALDRNPSDPDSLMALAKAQVRFGRYDEAVDNAARARRLHPMAPEYYAYVHGQALYAAGHLTEAAGVIDECLMRAPRDANCLLIRAALQAGDDRLDDAEATMASLVKANPRFSLAYERDYRRFGESPLMERFLSELVRAKAPLVTS